VRRLEETYAEQVDFHILNVDLLSTRELALQYGVSAIPNIVLLDAAGNLVQQMVGYQEENQLIEAVENLLEASN
jgi:thioredoxin-related protein